MTLLRNHFVEGASCLNLAAWTILSSKQNRLVPPSDLHVTNILNPPRESYPLSNACMNAYWFHAVSITISRGQDHTTKRTHIFQIVGCQNQHEHLTTSILAYLSILILCPEITSLGTICS
jgi:hypothetical protein